MKCVLCKQGHTQPGDAVVTLQRGESIVVFKGVPAQVCENCGEYYLSDEVTDQLLTAADRAVRDGAEVTIRRFAA
jgi:YgiT-type zinc finger domain-containing protein